MQQFLILELDSRWILLKVAGRAWHSLTLKLLRHDPKFLNLCIMLSGADITILVWVFTMHENASTHHWHIQNYKYALHIQCFFSGQKLTGVSQHLLRRNYSPSSLPFSISDLISTVPTKLMIPALFTMHKEKPKALSHLNGKYSESLEKDKANIKNHKKYVYCTPMDFLHTDAHSNFLY